MTVCYCKGAICDGDGEIPDGARRLDLAARLDWGTDDLREPWSGSYVFGSFACAARWAADKAEQHDSHVLQEGADEKHGNEDPPDKEDE